MMRARLALGFAITVFACGAPQTPGQSTAAPSELPKAFRQAFREEAIGDPQRAKSEYLAVMEQAAASESPWRLPVVVASLDALVGRSVDALHSIAPENALAYRTPGGIEAALEKVRMGAQDPFVKGEIARALVDLAEHRGDAAAASKWRAAAGCVREATVVGPIAWTAVTGVKDPGRLDRFDAPVESAYAAPGPFGARLAPATVHAQDCAIPLEGPSGQYGVREVVVDIEVPRAQKVAFALRAHTAAVLRAGGRVVVERPFELGSGEAVQRAWVEAPRGRLRVVARVAYMEESSHVEIDAWDDRGEALAMKAPAVGEVATAAASAVGVVRTQPPQSGDERLLAGAFALADGDGRSAERALADVAARPDAPPETLLAFARALETARDLSSVKRAERARAAYERVLEAWPASWEAILAHAVLAGTRRGSSEAHIEALRDLDEHRAKAGRFAAALLDAYDAATSGRERLVDRAAAAADRARASLAGTSLMHEVGRVAVDRVGPERVAYACAADGPRNTTACVEARRTAGDLAGAARELERLRTLAGTPTLYLAMTLQDALTAKDGAAAKRVFDAMSPGERTLSAYYAVTQADPAHTPSATATRKILELATRSTDAPAAIGSLLHALGDDPLEAFAGKTERVTADDLAKPILPDAPTAVLAHVERYEILAEGLLHAILYDVRRVGGTTDVEQNAQAEAPELFGRTSMRAVRRRIFKRDGRVLEPDRTPRASQAHAELAQLEKGDTVEAVYEGWAIPSDTGDLGFDTPDLLPDRTAVHDASVDVVLPEGQAPSMWTHPILGKATESREHGARVLHWELRDKPVRRIEDGVPRMDRSVSVSVATTRWTEVARGLREAIAALEEHDPELAAWAREAAQGRAPRSRAVVEAVVEAAGKTVRESNPSMLSDFALGRIAGPQQTTARTILTDHQGSRSWLIARALRELGIQADVAIAEDLPFSSDPSFPPHFGRFVHPLVVARVGGEEIWIDADVSGPPLPAGKISPELRGRSMLRATGTIDPVPSTSGGDARSEIDLRLAVDERGDARGSFAILLRGRDAQDMAEALFRIVGAERQRALRSVVLAWVPFANVDDVKLSSTEGSWQVAIRADVTASGYAQVEGTTPAARTWALPGLEPLHFSVPRPRVSSLGAFYAGQGSRENALAISSAVQYRVRRHIALPAGSVVSRLPGPFELKSPHLEAARRFEVNGASLDDEYVLSIATGTVPALEYGAFVTDAHKTDDAFLATTWVKPPPP